MFARNGTKKVLHMSKCLRVLWLHVNYNRAEPNTT